MQPLCFLCACASEAEQLMSVEFLCASAAASGGYLFTVFAFCGILTIFMISLNGCQLRSDAAGADLAIGDLVCRIWQTLGCFFFPISYECVWMWSSGRIHFVVHKSECME